MDLLTNKTLLIKNKSKFFTFIKLLIYPPSINYRIDKTFSVIPKRSNKRKEKNIEYVKDLPSIYSTSQAICFKGKHILVLRHSYT